MTRWSFFSGSNFRLMALIGISHLTIAADLIVLSLVTVILLSIGSYLFTKIEA